MGTLTVRENLMFSASLRLPSEIGKNDKCHRVEMILNDLGLNKVADSKVSRIYYNHHQHAYQEIFVSVFMFL